MGGQSAFPGHAGIDDLPLVHDADTEEPLRGKGFPFTCSGHDPEAFRVYQNSFVFQPNKARIFSAFMRGMGAAWAMKTDL